MNKKAYLILQNGTVFEGESFGAEGTVISEIVFATGMTGYLEALTDKCYFGQTVVQTFPLFGNYGVIPEDFESESVSLNGYIAKHWCREPSNFRSQGDLDTFFKAQNIVGLSGIDTRALAKVIRDNGTMNGMITTDIKNADPDAIASYKIKDAVKSVTTDKKYEVSCNGAKFRVAVLDLGVKKSMLNSLVACGCELTVFPATATADDILASSPDGIVLSEGPGDPSENAEIIATVRELIGKNIPIFAIGLGHQILALANGFKTAKLAYGHRGANQPVRDMESGRILITSQNHGYEVRTDSINTDIAKLAHVNNNDQTCEGIEYLNAPAFGIQFAPESFSDASSITMFYDKFIKMMEGAKNA